MPSRGSQNGEEILLRLTNVDWLPAPNVVESVVGPHPAARRLATSAVVLVTNARCELLLTRVQARGWDVPGGHLESGETPRRAAARELTEETGLAIPAGHLRPAGYVRLLVLAPCPPAYRYPYPESVMLAYSAASRQSGLVPQPGSECLEAAWCPQVAAHGYLQGDPWWPLAERVMLAARRQLDRNVQDQRER